MHFGRIRFLIWTMLLLLGATPLAFAAPPPSSSLRLHNFDATYTAKYHGIPAARGVRSLRIDQNGHYKFTETTHSLVPLIPFNVLESSEGSWTNKGPHPDEYQYHQSGLGKKRDIVSQFDWVKRICKTQKNDESYQTAIPMDAHDKVSYQLALRQDLLNNQSTLAYQIVDKDRIKTYTFGKTAQETIKIAAGKIKTAKMQRTNNNPNHGTVIFWLAPVYEYIPIQIIGIENGKVTAKALLDTYQPLS